MSLARSSLHWRGLVMACAFVAAASDLAGQVPSNAPARPDGGAGRANIPAPPLPSMKSPVETFRELLLMPADERRAFLAKRAPEAAKRLQEKIRDYQSLAPEERELRLQVTELRWYLLPMLNVEATNRAGSLVMIPEPTRSLVASRLELWDLLPPPAQEMLRTNEQAVGYWIGAGRLSNAAPSETEVQRRRLNEDFNRLMELTAKEKARVLGSLSEVERRRMEQTLEAFAKLPADQRRQCIRSFAQFATLSADQRQAFLKSADQWSRMTPAERQAWRELVSAAPMFPPLTARKPPQPPPLPPQVTVPLATNGR